MNKRALGNKNCFVKWRSLFCFVCNCFSILYHNLIMMFPWAFCPLGRGLYSHGTSTTAILKKWTKEKNFSPSSFRVILYVWTSFFYLTTSWFDLTALRFQFSWAWIWYGGISTWNDRQGRYSLYEQQTKLNEQTKLSQAETYWINNDLTATTFLLRICRHKESSILDLLHHGGSPVSEIHEWVTQLNYLPDTSNFPNLKHLSNGLLSWISHCHPSTLRGHPLLSLCRQIVFLPVRLSFMRATRLAKTHVVFVLCWTQVERQRRETQTESLSTFILTTPISFLIFSARICN